MANDGAIDILINLDTVVDAQNAVKGVENLRKQVTQIFKHLGDDIVNGGLSKASTGLNKFITDFNDAWTSLPKNLQSQFDISSAFDVTNGVAKLQDLYNALSEIADKVRESSVEYQDLEAEIRNSRNEISALYATAMQDPNMAKGLALVEKMSTDSENAFKYLAQYNFLPAETKQSLNELFSMIDRVQEKIMEFTQEQANLDIGKLHISKEGPATELLTEFSQVAEITQTVIGNIEEMQSAYTQMTSQISSEYASSFGKLEDFGPKFTAIYNKITALGNKKVISPHAFDDMEAAIEKVKDSAQETKEKLVEMLENKKAFAAGDKASEQAEEQEYSRLIALVNDLNERYEEVVNHLNEVRDAANEAGDAQEDAGNRGKQASKNMNKDSAGLVGSIRKIAYTARAFNYMTRMIAEPFKAVWNILKKIGSAIWSLLGQVRQFMSRVASGILNVFKRAYAQIKKIFSKIISGFTGIFSKVHLLNFSFGSFVKAATSGLKKVLRLFMRFGLGARSSYFLIRRLRSAFIEMYKAAAEQIPEINKQVSSIMMKIKSS